MALYPIVGDIFESDCTLIIHQANSVMKMRSGFAKALVALYPEAMVADTNFGVIDSNGHFRLYTPEERLGNYSSAVIARLDRTLTIVNLYGQLRPKTNEDPVDLVMTSYEAFENALRKLLTDLGDSVRDYKIGVPDHIGCGLARGNWRRISWILEKVSNEFGVDIYSYKLPT